jgi:PiT family inorganic phosphate transporter
MDPFLLMVLVILVAVVFEYINGFHDAANAIATVVSTRVLTPRQAIMLAACTNLIGAFYGTAVAATIAKGFVHDPSGVTQMAIACGLMGGIVWNLITWWFGIPSSSSHALIGGLCGGVLGQTHMNWGRLMWNEVPKLADGTLDYAHATGLWPKLIKPMVLSPLIGFTLGVIFMVLLTVIIVRLSSRPSKVQKWFGKLQLISAGMMGFSHGMNDSQKTVGIIMLALTAGAANHAFDSAPSWMQFMQPAKDGHVPFWIIALCAATMAAGTAAGGWRIIRTLGHKMVKLQPVHGFAAETAAALTIGGASLIGMPVSTTHVISTSILGVGATKRFDAVKWGLVGRIVWAWVLTLPITITLGYLFYRGALMIGWAG